MGGGGEKNHLAEQLPAGITKKEQVLPQGNKNNENIPRKRKWA
jgi:hypothetical protein